MAVRVTVRKRATYIYINQHYIKWRYSARDRKEARHLTPPSIPYTVRSDHMRIVYRTESRVINHINHLRRAYGYWPGYVKCKGGYCLTFDPDAPSPGERERDEDGPWHD